MARSPPPSGRGGSPAPQGPRLSAASHCSSRTSLRRRRVTRLGGAAGRALSRGRDAAPFRPARLGPRPFLSLGAAMLLVLSEEQKAHLGCLSRVGGAGSAAGLLLSPPVSSAGRAAAAGGTGMAAAVGGRAYPTLQRSRFLSFQLSESWGTWRWSCYGAAQHPKPVKRLPVRGGAGHCRAITAPLPRLRDARRATGGARIMEPSLGCARRPRCGACCDPGAVL